MLEEFKIRSIEHLNENIPRIEKCFVQLSEEDIWKRPNKSSNTIGNLIVHLCGNIGQYIISSLGEEKDNRERDLEFSMNGGHNKAELLKLLSTTVEKAVATIGASSETTMMKRRLVQGFDFTGIAIVMHVVEHFAYHTGQIAFWTKLLKDKGLGFYEGQDLNTKTND